MDGRLKWLGRVDGFLWLVGAALVLWAVVYGLGYVRSLLGILRGTWIYSSGTLFVLGVIALIVIVFRWRASREEADLLRKYPPRPR